MTVSSDVDDIDAVESFLESNRSHVDDDGVAYDPDIFSRWQKYGNDRLYVNDPGEGYIELTTDGPIIETPPLGRGNLVHPNDPVTHISSAGKGATAMNDDGSWVINADDGASVYWPIVYIPPTEDLK